MTTTAPRPHPDGGTVQALAFAETARRWGIAITRRVTYRGAIHFEVTRVNPKNEMLTIGRYPTEAAARDAGNRAWRQERA